MFCCLTFYFPKCVLLNIGLQIPCATFKTPSATFQISSNFSNTASNLSSNIQYCSPPFQGASTDSCPNKKDHGWKAIRPTLVTDLQFFQRPVSLLMYRCLAPLRRRERSPRTTTLNCWAAVMPQT